MVWKLKDLDTPLVIDIKSGDIFGRSEGSYKFPECQSMSRTHIKITMEKNFPYLMDLESYNGTYVNSVRVEPNTKILLGNGHIIMFGGKTFMVKGGEET